MEELLGERRYSGRVSKNGQGPMSGLPASNQLLSNPDIEDEWDLGSKSSTVIVG